MLGTAIVVCFLAGLFSGLLGIGGGLIIVLMSLIFNSTQKTGIKKAIIYVIPYMALSLFILLFLKFQHNLSILNSDLGYPDLIFTELSNLTKNTFLFFVPLKQIALNHFNHSFIVDHKLFLSIIISISGIFSASWLTSIPVTVFSY